MKKNMPERKGECVSCGECCQRVRITSVYSHLVANHGSIDEARIYYSYRGIRLAEALPAIDRVMLEIDIPCSQLTADNKCRLHETPEQKPLICHKYPWFKDDIEGCGYRFE